MKYFKNTLITIVLLVGLTLNPKTLKNISILNTQNYKQDVIFNSNSLYFSPEITIKTYYGKSYKGKLYIAPMVGYQTKGLGDRTLFFYGGKVGYKFQF